jgi:hypothetical protein
MVDIDDGTEPEVATQVAGASGRTPLAADFMPAMIATLPILAVILLFALSDQPVLLRAILYEGNAIALAASFLPLFMPTIAALSIYLAAERGWLSRSPVATTRLAMMAAGSLALFVPLNYLFLQAGALTVGLVWRRVRRRSKRTRVVAVSFAALTMIATIGSIAEWKWSQLDHLPRTLIGRALDGITRVNIGEDEKRSVLVISVNDAYAIVASRDYPPQVEAIPLKLLETAELCQIPPNWNQRSVMNHLMGEAVSSAQPCASK